MWMSLAPSRAACVSSALIMRMIGASSADLEQVLDRRELLHHAREVGVALHFAHHGGGARFALRIGRADALRQLLGRPAARRSCTGYLRSTSPSALRGGARGIQSVKLPASVVFEQQLLAAREGVGQGVAHRFMSALIRRRLGIVGAASVRHAARRRQSRDDAGAASAARRLSRARTRQPLDRRHRRWNGMAPSVRGCVPRCRLAEVGTPA